MVQPKTDDRIRDGGGALDWSAIGRYADCVKIMAYYYHYAGGPPGPVAPPDWVDTITRFALTQMPKEKLCVILTLHGIDWGERQEAKMVDYEAAMRLANTYGAALQRDPATRSPHFEYERDGVRHQVWFEDSVSLREKVARLRRAGVPCIGLWELGTGTVLVQDTLRAAQR